MLFIIARVEYPNNRYILYFARFLLITLKYDICLKYLRKHLVLGQYNLQILKMLNNYFT